MPNTPAWAREMKETQDTILAMLRDVPSKEEFQMLVTTVQDHDHFINGNGQPAARTTMGEIRAMVGVLYDDYTRRQTPKPEEKKEDEPEKEESKFISWKWIVTVPVLGILGFLGSRAWEFLLQVWKHINLPVKP